LHGNVYDEFQTRSDMTFLHSTKHCKCWEIISSDLKREQYNFLYRQSMQNKELSLDVLLHQYIENHYWSLLLRHFIISYCSVRKICLW